MPADYQHIEAMSADGRRKAVMRDPFAYQASAAHAIYDIMQALCANENGIIDLDHGGLSGDAAVDSVRDTLRMYGFLPWEKKPHDLPSSPV